MTPGPPTRSAAQLLIDLLHLAFEASPPPAILALLPAAPAIDRFGAAPILTLGGGARAYVARVDDPGFLDRVHAAFPDPDLRDFFLSAPQVRWMLDTDGASATAYLDDLQDHPTHAAGPRGLTAMCATLHTPGHTRSCITRHGLPPFDLLDATWTTRLQRAIRAGLRGLWGVRWVDDAIAGLLCVNEDRWQGGHVEPAGAWLDRFAEPRWLATRQRAAADGFVAYPDAIEIRTDGAWDVTVGLVCER